MALRGSNEQQLRLKCKLWGVTKATENSYIETLIARLSILGNKK
jgi:hypothetical protein